MKNAATQFRGKSLAEIPDKINGKRIKILKNSNGHNYGPEGTVHYITTCPPCSGTNFNDASIRGLVSGLNNIMLTDFVVITSDSKQYIESEIKFIKKELAKVIEAGQKEIRTLEKKLTFLKEHNVDSISDLEFELYNTLVDIQVNGKTNLMKKAKLLAELL